MYLLDREISNGNPAYIVAEIGINHNGDLSTACELIEEAIDAGADAVKFQKRTVEKVVPKEKWDTLRETPWGVIPYIEYKKKLEFDAFDYTFIDMFCKSRDITWFASPWDVDSVDFLEKFNVPFYKVASASVTDHKLLEKIRATLKPVIMSCGMSTMEEVKTAVDILGTDELALLNCSASYPSKDSDLNLLGMDTLRLAFDFKCPIGHSGHELGIATSVAAVALGANIVERHITLDRSSWGSDQSASLEPYGFKRLVRDIRAVEKSYGDGIIRVTKSELQKRDQLRTSR